MRLILTALTALTLAACALPDARIRTGPDEPVLPVPGPDLGGDVDRGTTPALGPRARQVCRAAPTPRGWIAVDYMVLERECPRSPGDRGFNGAVLEYYSDRPAGSVMVICADEPTPDGWIREHTVPDHVCSGARVGEGEPTARRIRRVR